MKIHSKNFQNNIVKCVFLLYMYICFNLNFKWMHLLWTIEIKEKKNKYSIQF